jgi:hypothetical protein
MDWQNVKGHITQISEVQNDWNKKPRRTVGKQMAQIFCSLVIRNLGVIVDSEFSDGLDWLTLLLNCSCLNTTTIKNSLTLHCAIMSLLVWVKVIYRITTGCIP